MVNEIAKGVYWVGAVDWEIKVFHGHELSTHRGTTYNSYLITDKKTALVDTVPEQFHDALIENIREIIDPSKIDYIIAPHFEPDHSGSLPEIIKLATNAELIVSKRGEESFMGHFHHSWKVRTVKSMESINIGKNDLVFIEAPMLHWPDSMFTYLTASKILMPNDAFGQHFASAFRFNDQVDRVELYAEALKYYANILTLYSKQVTRKIEELLALNLPVEMIAPSHGIIWRDDPLQIVRKYSEWAIQKPEKRAVIIYDTMWNATRQMAEAIGEGLFEKGVDHSIINAAVSDRNDIISEVFRSKAVILGSPTFNNGVLPTIAPVLEDLRGLKFKNKIGAAFGSYGWSGESVKVIEEHLGKCGIPVVTPGVNIKWRPDTDGLEQCRALGRNIADVILKEEEYKDS